MMTADEVKAVFKKHDEEFLKFERIPAHTCPSKRPDLCGFILLDKLLPNKTRDIISGASHDEIWLDVELHELASVATEDTIVTLLRCGVHYEDASECLHMYT